MISIFSIGIEQGLIWAVVAFGVYVSFRILDFADLSIEGSLPFGGCISAILIFGGMNPYLALLFSFIGGAIAGLLTGVLHTKLKIPAILSGIITMTGLSSINLVLLGLSYGEGQSRSNLVLSRNIFNIAYDKLKGLFDLLNIQQVDALPIIKLIVAFLFLVIIFLSIYYFFGTELGMNLRATGNNLVMAKSQSIDTDFMIILGLMISNALIALGGALFVNDMAASNETDGKGAIVIGLSAIIIGEMLFGKKRSFKVSLISIVLGSIIFFIIKNIAVNLGVQHLLNLLVAILLIVILAIPEIKKRINLGGKKKC